MRGIYLLLTALLIGKTGVEGQALPTQKEQYKFMNWYLNNTQPKHISIWLGHLNPAKLKTSETKLLEKLKLTGTENKYLLRQLTDAENRRALDTLLLKANWAASPKNTDKVTLISLPVFTRDRKLAIIYKYYGSNNMNNETVKIYVKIKAGVWRICGIQPYYSWETSGIDD